MGKRLFVGGLPYETTEQDLATLFAACGQVTSVKIIIDRDSGQSKGFGFIDMGSDEEAKTAISKMNNHELGSRRLVVNEARPMEERPRGGFGGGGGGGGGYGGKGGGYGGKGGGYGGSKGHGSKNGGHRGGRGGGRGGDR